jgi:hypothetical protein
MHAPRHRGQHGKIPCEHADRARLVGRAPCRRSILQVLIIILEV